MPFFPHCHSSASHCFMIILLQQRGLGEEACTRLITPSAGQENLVYAKLLHLRLWLKLVWIKLESVLWGQPVLSIGKVSYPKNKRLSLRRLNSQLVSSHNITNQGTNHCATRFHSVRPIDGIHGWVLVPLLYIRHAWLEWGSNSQRLPLEVDVKPFCCWGGSWTACVCFSCMSLRELVCVISCHRGIES